MLRKVEAFRLQLAQARVQFPALVFRKEGDEDNQGAHQTQSAYQQDQPQFDAKIHSAEKPSIVKSGLISHKNPFGAGMQIIMRDPDADAVPCRNAGLFRTLWFAGFGDVQSNFAPWQRDYAFAKMLFREFPRKSSDFGRLYALAQIALNGQSGGHEKNTIG